ncbi:MAG: methyl-accepting chemotaxis protein [Fibromonadaceae bacterium]|jgi:methyl-accepting chemotaxis protein|nr:methyl-accepting chemotaxis protein [Fibromonadaceae bacterium]
MKNISIGKKLVLLLTIFIMGYAIFGFVSFSTLNHLRINGNLYNQIIMSKDLIADVLPPPEYIIESYINVLRMADESEPARIDYFSTELRRLQADYEKRHQFWINEPLLEAGTLRNTMLTDAYYPAAQFYEIVFNQFIPALKNGDREYAKGLVQGELNTLYEAHRKSVDQVVLAATEKYEKTETLAIMKIQNDTKLLFSIAFVVIVAAIILSLIIRSSITRPLRIVVDSISKIENGDMTVRVGLERRDELGILSKALDSLSEKLQTIFNDLRQNSDTLAGSAEELSSIGRQVTNTTEQVTVNISAVASGAAAASTNANEVAGTAEEMSTNMNTMAVAVEELSASINQIANNAIAANQIASEAAVKSREATEAMNKLGAAAKEIGHVTEVIKRIAEKTNLLALNATIEAASAGAAGRGFAVVAGEIKELANQSAKSADDITRRIEGIQSGTNEAVTVIGDVSKIIAQINHSVEVISNHVDQQTKASNEIASNVAQVNIGAKRVASAISEVARGSKDMSRNVEEVAKGSISAQNTRQINQGADELAKLASSIKSVLNNFEI